MLSRPSKLSWPRSPRSPVARRSARWTACALATFAFGATAATATTAAAAETGQPPMQTYAPPPNYTPPPNYAPPPNYTPPPNYVAPPPTQPQAPPPGYAPAPSYAPPPSNGGYSGGGNTNYNRGATPNDVGRAGGIVNGLLGFGAHTGSGFGLGVEGGYSLPMHLFIGGNFDYFTGSDDVSSYLLQVQVGYDLAVIPNVPVLIRPYGALGYQHVSENACIDLNTRVCVDAGGGSGVLSLGVLGAYFFTPNWFAGVDLRLDIATAGYGWTVFDFFGTGGYKF